ncbi:hypothetical protein LCGC14_2649460, partial [marine sediment metagenome]
GTGQKPCATETTCPSFHQSQSTRRDHWSPADAEPRLARAQGTSRTPVYTHPSAYGAIVRTHMGRLFEKLDVQDRVELILYLMRKSKVTYRPAKH